MSISSVKTGAIGDSLLAGNAAFNPSSFESIATVTGTGSSGTITFSSIPSTYTHLQIRAISRDTFASTFIDFGTLTFNGSTTGYAAHWLYGDGSTTNAFGSASRSNTGWWLSLGNNNTSGIVSATIYDIHDYASTTKNKTIRIFSGVDTNGAGRVAMTSGLWANTSAVTSISFTSPNANFTTNTVFSLYGIKGA
jgi:hypothetical protein